MRKLILSFSAGALLLTLACSKVPVSGRKQVNLLPESELMSMSLTDYRQFMNENKVSTNTANVQTVQRVGNNIANAVVTYLRSKKMSDRIEGYKWEFNLVEDNTVNAWCMPGGKVVVYTGILPVTQTDAGLAVVMGHEIAHAVARHGNERMSQQMLVQMGGIALDVATANKPAETRNLFMAAYGAGSEVGIMLPYSRLHETEADKLGLIFMAIAGYNPDEAVNFWKRMSAASKGQKPPEILSTHPSDQTRINDLQAYLPEARKYYTPKK